MQEGRTYCSDLGDGTYLNPLMHGEYPDPSILKDGADYYMVNCSQPLMWHSQDLLHWEPLYELSRYGITGGAADLCKVGNTYYIYNVYPFGRDKADYKPTNMWVLTTRDIRSGVWDGPFDVGPAFNTEDHRELIDPGHVTDFDGKRYLYTSDNYVFPLTDDGLHYAGPGKRVLADEVFPDDWDIQGVFTEGPRFTVHDGYIYLSLSVGGTQGPAQAHGILEYRAKSALGPWEPCPYNPIMRTYSRHEKWINKGHGIPVEAPDGSWYIIYHAFLRNRYNQARMPLMEPIEWTGDGWYRIPEWSSPAKPLPAPKGGRAVRHAYPTKIVFPEKDALPGEWIYKGNVKDRMTMVSEGMKVHGQGTSIHDCGGVIEYRGLYKDFQITVHATAANGAGAGLGMYFTPKYSVGFALKDGFVWPYNCEHFNLTRYYNAKQFMWDQIWLRITVKHEVLSGWVSADGEHWEKMINSFNLFHIDCQGNMHGDGSMGMLPALFTFGTGDVIYHSFEIEELHPED